MPRLECERDAGNPLRITPWFFLVVCPKLRANKAGVDLKGMLLLLFVLAKDQDVPTNEMAQVAEDT